MMITPIRIFVSLIILAFAVGGALQAQVKRHSDYVRSEKKATAIVNRVVKSSPVIDGHNDVFVWYFGCGYIDMAKCPQDIHDYPLDIVQKGHTDIPRWRKGGVGGVMINVFADSLSTFLDAYDLLYRLEDEYNNDLRVVTSSNEMRKEMKRQNCPCPNAGRFYKARKQTIIFTYFPSTGIEKRNFYLLYKRSCRRQR